MITLKAGVASSEYFNLDGIDYPKGYYVPFHSNIQLTPALKATETLTLTGQPTATVKATETLTFTGNAVNGDTVTVNTTVYTFQDTLTDVDGNVHIGALATNTIDNLVAAITLGAGAGTDYATSMVVHDTCTAVIGVGDTMDIEALSDGTAANSFPTTDDNANMAWGDTTMSGGVSGQTVTVNTTVYTFQTFLSNVNGNVLIGATASDTIDNLKAAITLGSGSGTLYAALTTIHATVTATIGAGDTMDVQAKSVGTAANSYPTTETLTNGSWGDTTMSGGTAEDVLDTALVEVGLRNLYDQNEILQSAVRVTQWENGSAVAYSALNTLLSDMGTVVGF